jgi:plastocyanin
MTAALVGAPSAVGGASTITATNNVFTPAKTNVAQGTSVTWSFSGTHTTTSNQSFWNSNLRSTGSTYSKAMPSAGKFPYHCTVHAGMNGSIVVPLKASGSASSGWTLRWSASSAANGRAFDVQFRRMGRTEWRSFRNNTTAATGLFNPTRSATYQLRARTSNTAAGKESGWSPVISREIS